MERQRDQRAIERRARLRALHRRRRLAGALMLASVVAVVALLFAGAGLGADRDGAAASAHRTRVPPRQPAAVTDPGTSATTAPTATRPVNIYRDILPGHFSKAVRGVPARVYVPNSDAGTVTEINPATFRVIRTFRTGAYDQHITPSWNLKRLYVNNTTANTLTVLNPRTGRPVRTIPVTDPYNLYFTPDGTKAIVVAEAWQRVDFRNPHTWHLIASVHIPSPGPDHLDFTADGRSFLISCEYGGTVYRVSTSRMRVTKRIAVGGLPVDVKLSPDGTRFYVANQGTGGVTMISARTLRVIGFIHTGDGAHGLAISRNTRDLYVGNRLAGTISVISFARHRVVHTWHVGGSPDMLQVTPDGGRLWVSNRFNNSVSVISTHSGRVIHTIAVGASPHGLAYFPQPGRYSLGHNGVYR